MRIERGVRAVTGKSLAVLAAAVVVVLLLAVWPGEAQQSPSPA